MEAVAHAVATPEIPNHAVSLADFGKGDGQTLNTDAFDKAIAELSARGGGQLNVPPGKWLTGPIKLRSHINLHLERGALIQFSRDYRLYPLKVVDIRGDKKVDTTSPISGENLENVAITGEGTLDGGGDAWRPAKKSKFSESQWHTLVKSGGVLDEKGKIWWPSRGAMDGNRFVSKLRESHSLNPADYEPAHQFLRPKMLDLTGCKKVLLQDFTIQNPPNWTMHPHLCEDVSILNVTVHNSPAAQNSDALDLESCRHAVIRDCNFDTGDDGICLKSGRNAVGRRIGVPTEDVLVENCTVYHAHGGFTIGSEMSGGVRNVRVNHCRFIGSEVGLRFKSARGRGGVVENIWINDIQMTNIPREAISFSMSYGGKASEEETVIETGADVPPATEETPQFRDIHIENVVCNGAQMAMLLQGLPEMPLRNIKLKNVSIASERGISVTDAENISFENVRVINKTGQLLKTTRISKCLLDFIK